MPSVSINSKTSPCRARRRRQQRRQRRPSCGRAARAFCTAEGQLSTPLEQEALLGTNDLVEVSFIERCRLVQNCVARVRVRAEGRSGWGTGFLVAPGLLLTNHHVLPTPDTASTSLVEFGYWFNVAGAVPSAPDEFGLDPGSFFESNEDLDFAVVAVAQRGALGTDIAGKGYLRLIPETGKVQKDDFVTILQHPDGDPMQIALRENKVLRAEDGETFIWYVADTAHGSSGAPVFNDTFQLVCLHAKGIIRRDSRGWYARKNGTWVEKLDGLKETDVIWDRNLGFRVSRISEALLAGARIKWPARVARIEEAMRGGDVLSRAVAQLKGGPGSSQRPADITEESAIMPADKSNEQPNVTTTSAQGIGLVVPLQLRITLEAGGATQPVVDSGTTRTADKGALEAEAFEMRVPIIYDGLDEREGFKAGFLEFADGADAPKPQLTTAGTNVLAPLLDGSGYELKYHRFSIWMHKARRLALFTASNVDWRDRKKMVQGKSTSREALAGFPENSPIAEQWVDDPRVDAEHQLPDIFYTDDHKAFDKGHIVRRDDVCWGKTYQDIQMSNGDTFHVTNCSPQIKEFNQGARGQENWGISNPISRRRPRRMPRRPAFSPDRYSGKMTAGFTARTSKARVRVQIPTRFWKIVVVKGTAGPQAYGFILEQDVRDITEEEFFVTEEWIGALKPIKKIASELRGWLKLDALEACDAYDTVARA